MSRHHVHIPENLVRAASKHPGQTPEDTLHWALTQFCHLREDHRFQIVKEWEWEAARDEKYVRFLPYPESLQLASKCRPSLWSRDQTVVAALDWFLHTY